MELDPVIILTGPTAVGKTKLSIELAKRLNAEIISADSMQIYKYMDIGSAKITEQEMDGVKHHLIDIVNPDQEFSVSDFKEIAEKKIKDIQDRGNAVIITGGTGLYLNSIIYDMDFGETKSDEGLRKELSDILEEKGKNHLHNMLKDLSPESAKRIHPNNTNRVIRAIEVYKLGGEMKDFSRDLKMNKNINSKIIVLSRDREVLYERINKRVEIMLEQGLIDEVKSLVNMGYTKELTSMKAIGYKEIIEYIEGNISLEDAIDKVKQNSRRYAKRQITWFKKYNTALQLDLDNIQSVEKQIDEINVFIDQKNI
ncbi:tRNA (adenosine(37)-N6)-dimethylallyltransferase MiaA [Peptostreptococcus faecalis]|uniref:tRNA (adenosine(37)-N6)-dimethylallyltransferase MiaA n=1 Tax=Peptostreptococcus faecalis TaxID=2045015 RepID=UPI000C7DD4E9|nr:tRNA (adenosine(37)-N6)-dimethylallyltransferase MiaA [Peptostreptococcus faecalis]